MATFHIPTGGLIAVFEGDSPAPIADYADNIYHVTSLSTDPQRTFVNDSPFNYDDFTHFIPGNKYYWNASKAFDIIT